MKSALNRLFIALLIAFAALAGQALLGQATVPSANADELQPGVAPALNLNGFYGNNGFTVAVTNYDSATTYTSSATQGTVTSVVRTTASGQRILAITVQSIPIDDSATLTVTAAKSGYTSESSSVVGYAKKSALIPVFGVPEPTFDGFTVTVLNYRPDFTWVFTNDLGVYASIDSTGLITVTRLNVPDPTTLVVTTSASGYLSGESSVVGQNKPLTESPTPTLGLFELGADGLTVPISNYDSAFDWAIGTSGGGAAYIDTDGLIHVTDLVYGLPVTVQLTISRYGYTTKSITFEAQPLMPAYLPSFGEVVSTSEGFTTELTDFDESYTYQVSASFGTATLEGRYITVTGLEPGQSSTVTVLKIREDSVPAAAQITGQAALLIFIPEVGNAQAQEDGFAVPFLNYEPAFDWSIQILGNPSPGVTASFISGWYPGVGTVTLVNVSGALHGETIDLEVIGTLWGYQTVTLRLTGHALYESELITFTNYVQTSDGFTVEYLNHDQSFDWTLSVTSGTISYGPGNTLVVSGLSPGQSAILEVNSVRRDTFDGRFQFEGRALESEIPNPGASSGSTDSSDSSDSTESIDSSSMGQQAAWASILAEANERARMREVAEAVIRAREEAKAAEDAKRTAESAVRLAKDLKAIERFVNGRQSPTVADIRTLTANQLALLPVKVATRMSLGAITALTAKQAAGLTASQLRWFTVTMLKALKPAAIGALKPETLAVLSASKLKALTKAQVKQIWLGQWLQLDADQRKALKR